MDKIKEIWKAVRGYGGRYEVSNHGRVRSVKIEESADSKCAKKIYKILSTPQGYTLKKRKNGETHKYYNYPRICLSLNKHEKCYCVHQLVAEAFLGVRPEQYTVNHIDGNPLNNCVWNLEYCTLRENIEHAYQNHLAENRQRIVIVKPSGSRYYSVCRSLREASYLVDMDHATIHEGLKKHGGCYHSRKSDALFIDPVMVRAKYYGTE